MSSCSFWSTNKERINCYAECPMNITNNKRDICPFKEFLVKEVKVSFNKNINEDIYYSQDIYSGYSENDTVLSY